MTKEPVNNKNKKAPIVTKYIVFTIIFSIGIAIFSLIMSSIASYRNDLSHDNYIQTSRIYNGPLTQAAPKFDSEIAADNIYQKNNLTAKQVKYYLDNTSLDSTDANVNIYADFVKKGLTLQPTYKTEFSSKYVLKNDLNEKSIVSFVFPLPINNNTNEISNAKLEVNGEEVKDSKTTVLGEYGDAINGLRWEGEIPANSAVEIMASYHTVGLSLFTYEGIENSKGSQDFNFSVKIHGTRAYDIAEGLSVDKREFGDKFVKLTWNKPDLYSTPLINVSVGDKLPPSVQVSRVYLIMTPLYIFFISIILYLSYKFGKKLEVFDMGIITTLFVIYFPLIHYVSSFTVDPTIEVYENFKDVGYFSMPLYAAFLISALVIGGLKFYFLSKISGVKFAAKFGIPTLALFIGFFPLVITVPEYSMLLVIIGVIALITIVLQVRVKMLKS